VHKTIIKIYINSNRSTFRIVNYFKFVIFRIRLVRDPRTERPGPPTADPTAVVPFERGKSVGSQQYINK
jgi:hypothetical protein